MAGTKGFAFEAISEEEVRSLTGRATHLRRFESAQLVWDALAKAGQKGLTKDEIKKKTGLTNGQVTYAFGFIKDVLMEKYSQPLVCHSRTYRYSLPHVWLEVKDYLDFRVLGILTQARRLESLTNAAAQKWGNKGAVKLAKKHVTRLREDLEDLAGV